MKKYRVLVAEEDLALHQVVRDILEMTYRDIVIERALNYDSLLTRLRETGTDYDAILYDIDFDDHTGADALPSIREEFKPLLGRFVLLVARSLDIDTFPAATDLPYIYHPFSLDEFVATVKKVVESQQ